MATSPLTDVQPQIVVSSPSSSWTTAELHLLRQSLSLLADGDFESRWQASKQLVKLGSDIIPELLSLLQASSALLVEDREDWEESDQPELQWFIARILGELKHPDAIESLIDLVQGDEPETAAIAAVSLAQSGELALNALEDLLTQKKTRLLAVQALGQMGISSAIPPLLSVVKAPEPEVRAATVQALTAFRDKRIPEVLMAALADPVSQVRLAALTGIGGSQRVHHGSAIADLVVPLLQDLNLEVAIQAAIVLGKLQQPHTLAALEQIVQNPLVPHSLKIQALRSMVWHESDAALQALGQKLQQLLQDVEASSNPTETRYLLTEGLRLLGRVELPSLQPLAAQILIDALSWLSELEVSNSAIAQELEVSAISAIALALSQLHSPEAFDPLVPFLATQSDKLRFHLLAALKNLAPDTGVQRLQALKQQSDPAVARGIDFVLAEWKQAGAL